MSMLFNPVYGWVGFFGFPYLTLVETASPVVEFFGYFIVLISWLLHVINWYGAMWFLFLAFGFPLFLTSICVLVQSLSFQWYLSLLDNIKMVIATILEQFGYRQMVLYYRLLGVINSFRGKQTWKEVGRQGFKSRD